MPIPDFRGSSPLKAQDWFARYGLKPAVDERPSDQFAQGQIFDQQPAPGTDVYVVKEARLFVSAGPPPPVTKPQPPPSKPPTSDAPPVAKLPPVLIPDFTGWSRVSAEQWLASYRTESGDR